MVISSLTRSPYERALLATGLAEVKLTLFAKLSLFVFPLIVAYRLWG